MIIHGLLGGFCAKACVTGRVMETIKLDGRRAQDKKAVEQLGLLIWIAIIAVNV